jgi:outer membrane immunogenic protein
MKKICSAVSALLMATATSYAADLPMKAALAPAPVDNWTGLYIGANGGWRGNMDPTVAFSAVGPLANFVGPGSPIGLSTSGGAIGGFQVGYNYRVNRTWVAGIETDFDFAHMGSNGSSLNFAAADGTSQFMSDASEKLEWFGTVRARLGYLWSNNFLVFASGGVAYGDVAQSANYNNLSVGAFGVGGDPGLCLGHGATCFAGTSSHVAVGWTAGAGLEYALSSQWTVKAEYLYVDLGGTSLVMSPTSPSISFDVARFSPTAFHVARAGINFRF